MYNFTLIVSFGYYYFLITERIMLPSVYPFWVITTMSFSSFLKLKGARQPTKYAFNFTVANIVIMSPQIKLNIFWKKQINFIYKKRKRNSKYHNQFSNSKISFTSPKWNKTNKKNSRGISNIWQSISSTAGNILWDIISLSHGYNWKSNTLIV